MKHPSISQRCRRALIGAVVLCGLVAGLAASLVAISLDLWLTGAWLAVASLGFAGTASPWTGRCRAASAMALFVSAGLGVFGWHRPVLEFANFMDKAAADIETHGAAALGTRNRLGVYGFNLAMGGVGYVVGLDEVAHLTWLLATPGPRVRHRDGAFLLRDPAVREAAREAGTKGTARVAWTRYFHPSVSPSVALAANCPLVLSRGRQGGVVARCSVQYPKRSTLSFGRIAGREVSLQEGVYWVLQEVGWLHPFEVAWQISESDIASAPRHAEPVLLSRERFLLWLFAAP